MNTKLRTVIIACIVFAALLSAVIHRLDSDTLLQQLQAQLQRHHGSLSASHASFSIMRGFALRLDQVTFNSETLDIDAKRVFLGCKLLPLLTGEVIPDWLSIQSANIILKHDTPALLSLHLPQSFNLSQLKLIGASLSSSHIERRIDNLQLDARNLGRDHTLRWELKGNIEKQMIQSQGQASLRHGEVINLFAKVKSDPLPLKGLYTGLPTWMTNKEVGGAVTLDLNNRKQWQLFGEISLTSTKSSHAPVHLRGKVYGNSDQLIAWNELFAHLGSAISLKGEGSCRVWGECRAHLFGENIAMVDLIPFLDLHEQAQHLSGRGDVDFQWHMNREIDSLALTTSLKSLRYTAQQQPIDFPEPTNLSLMIGNSFHHKRRTFQLQLTHNQEKISLHSSEERIMQMEFQQAEKLWPPVIKLFTHHHSLPSPDKTAGMLTGTLQLRQGKNGNIHIQSSLDLSPTALAFDGSFSKESGVPLKIAAEMHWQHGELKSLDIDHATLLNSQINKLHWQKKDEGYQLRVAKSRVVFDRGIEKGIHWNGSFANLRGHLSGSGSLSWPLDQGAFPTITPLLEGRFSLHGFGTSEQRFTGNLTASQGRITSDKLEWISSANRAELRGYLDLNSQQGRLDIEAANIKELIPTSGLLSNFSLQGNLSAKQIGFLGQEWKDLKASYRIQGEDLNFQDLHATWATGNVNAGYLHLFTKGGERYLSAKIRAKAVQLEQLPSLKPFVKASISGQLFANIALEEWPITTTGNFGRGNGDIAIFHMGWQEKDREPFLVNRAEFRFKLRPDSLNIKQLHVTRQGHHFSGHATLNSIGQIDGSIENQSSQESILLSGEWPTPQWHAVQTSDK